MFPCIVTCEHVGVMMPYSEDDVLSQLSAWVFVQQSVHLLVVWVGYLPQDSPEFQVLQAGDCPTAP